MSLEMFALLKLIFQHYERRFREHVSCFYGLPLWRASVLSPRRSPQEALQEEVVGGAPPQPDRPATRREK